MTFLDLPDVPPELKNVSPYIQRADELFTKDPVMSYWSAYYAAQVGITLKPKAPASRTYLVSLLDALERMKTAIGDSDAIHDESASSAYVENFALKVFAMADNEDRLGQATRGTAKKFLAAANFLEILRTFDKEKLDAASPAPDSTEEKIRYAKWKAADIAKAFREGRKPTPGPAGSELEPSPATASPAAEAPSLTPPSPAITDLPGPQQDELFQQPLPAHVPDELVAHTLPGASSSMQSPAWSTAATPGTPGRPLDAVPSRSARRTQLSDELEGRSDGSITPIEESPSRKEVRFTPSVADGTSPPGPSIALPPPVDPEETGLPPGFVPDNIHPDPTATPLLGLPPGFVPSAPPLGGLDGEDAPRTFELPSPPPFSPPSGTAFRPTHPPSGPLSPPTAPVAPPAVAPVAPPPAFPVAPAPVASAAPAPMVPVTQTRVPVLDTAATAVPAELTPQLMARVQKHCRFAISALDYEDAEQARKELRAALRMLGG
ncbi:DUF605-domain-containing protein [Daedalea quercina L-15889]|uniref:DUF605-domain-containing protein n=1 Tax=Daedalea quercina L-15889 TaxID=1314783 RepID=A0A165ULN6_9APHY|nr:DUF605-domain-containing protein [Daedalea quercina L-15889]